MAQKQAPKFESDAPKSTVALSDSPLGSDPAAQGAPSGLSQLQSIGVGPGSSKSGSEAPKVPVALSGLRLKDSKAKSDAPKFKSEAPKCREGCSLPVSSPPLHFNDESRTVSQHKQAPKFESEAPKVPVALSDSPLGSDPAVHQDAPTELSQLQPGGVGPKSRKYGSEAPKGPVDLSGSRPEDSKAKSDALKSKSEAPKGRESCNLPVSSPPQQSNDEFRTLTKQAPKFESEAPKVPVALSDSPLGSDLEAHGSPIGSSQLQHGGVGPGSSKSRSEAPKGPADLSGSKPEDGKAKSDAPKSKSMAPKGRESCNLTVSSPPLATNRAEKQAPKFESEAPKSRVALSDSPLGSDPATQGAPCGLSQLQSGYVGLGSSKSGSKAPKVPVALSGSRPEGHKAKADAPKFKSEVPKGRESCILPASSPPLPIDRAPGDDFDENEPEGLSGGCESA